MQQIVTDSKDDGKEQALELLENSAKEDELEAQIAAFVETPPDN